MSTDDDTPGQVTDEPVEEEEREAQAGHGADRPPTAEEEEAAERNAELPPGSAKAYEEAIERGADIVGEGQIDL
ncbi:MAG: hypothetical protein ACXV8G_10905 [Acidimicrobiales bacterium]